MRKIVATFLFFFAFNALAASPEYLVGQTVPAPAPWSRFSPSVASDGTDYLIVWGDNRSGSGAVIATRVTREGRVVDPLGIRIGESNFTVSGPSVVWDGEAYLIVWGQFERDFRQTIRAARVAPHGGIVMLPRVIAENAHVGGNRQYVASNGTISVVAYIRDYTYARAVVLDRDGNPLRHENLGNDPDYPSDLTITAGNSRFVAAWHQSLGFPIDDDTIQAVALTSSGHVIDSPITVGPGELPAIGGDGTRFTIASRRNNTWQSYTLLSRTFDENLDPVGDQQSLLTSSQIVHPQVLWIGNRYEVLAARRSYPGGNEIVSVALDAQGTPQSGARVRAFFSGEASSLPLNAATNGTDVVLARTDDGPPQIGQQIFAYRYPGNTTLSELPQLLSWSGNVQREPAIASGASGHVVAWAENGSGVFATRVDGNGNSLDGRGLLLSTYPYGLTRVAFDGTNYVVAWRDANFIGLRWISPLTGATVAQTQVNVAPFVNFTIAAAADATYVVFTDDRVRVTRIPHATYTPDSDVLAVSPDGMGVNNPAAVWNGSTLLVAWNEELFFPQSDPPFALDIAILAARVRPNLTLIDSSPIVLRAESRQESGAYNTYGAPAVATNGTDWLVVADHNNRNIIANRLWSFGIVDSATLGTGVAPVVAWDGTRYAVVWQSGLHQDLTRPLVMTGVPSGGPLAAGSRTFVANGTASSRASIAATADARVAVAYTKISFAIEHAGVERSYFRVMELGAPRGRTVRP